jgi:hypothetical protein
MSGQEVSVRLASAPALAMGSTRRDDLVIGVLDMSGLPDEFDVDGFLSLEFFAGRPFTVDYPRGLVVVESAASLAARATEGDAVDLRLEREEQSVVAFLPLTVPGRESIEVEVDTGSNTLILDEALAADVGVSLDDPAVRTLEGKTRPGIASSGTSPSFAAPSIPPMRLPSVSRIRT